MEWRGWDDLIQSYRTQAQKTYVWTCTCQWCFKRVSPGRKRSITQVDGEERCVFCGHYATSIPITELANDTP